MVGIATNYLSHDKIVQSLLSEGEERKQLFSMAAELKERTVGNIVYFRGLVEYSNVCRKNCYYCGIRCGNTAIDRYTLSDEEVMRSARFAYESGYGSLVMQCGERTSPTFTKKITELVKGIKKISNGNLGITLSCGEQSTETYRSWFEAGAHRYLLRIETANLELYERLHPHDKLHSFKRRVDCLRDIKQIGYQVGTGVMIGLPDQTYTDLAHDLKFMQQLDIDMVGMGPYIAHAQTPLAAFKGPLLPLQERFDLTLKMIALLRIMMPDINIAAATAMQAIDKMGREKAVKAGANVVMPNITPGIFRDNYKLYDNKPCMDELAEDCKNCLEVRVALTDHTIGYNQWGDSQHFHNRNIKH